MIGIVQLVERPTEKPGPKQKANLQLTNNDRRRSNILYSLEFLCVSVAIEEGVQNILDCDAHPWILHQ